MTKYNKALVCLLILSSISLGYAQNNSKSQKRKIEDISKRISNYADKGKFNGALLIATKENILLDFVYGEDTKGKRNRLSDSFDIASIGKMFTGIIFAQLEAEGKINYSDLVEKYLPNYPNVDARKKVTIHHLLTHSSGIPDIFNFKFIENVSKKHSISIEIYFNHFKENPSSTQFFEDLPLEFEPGSKFSYSNSGYLILGLIIEEVTGLSYQSYVQKTILDKINLKGTNIISSYGGGQTTLNDMYKFYRALDTNGLLDSANFYNITTGKIEIEKDKYYAYGFEEDKRYNSRIITHKGGGMESKVQFMFFYVTDYFVIIYSNNNKVGYDAFNKLRNFIRKTLS